jgi:hypothetical protein
VATVFTVLFLAGLVPVTLLVGDTHFPSPLQPQSEIVAYFRENSTKVAICAFLQFGSAIPLGIYTATMTSRLRFLGIRAAGIDIALFGGLGAAFRFALAVIGELSALSLVIQALFLIPLTRFPGFVWLIAAGFRLPARRA